MVISLYPLCLLVLLLLSSSSLFIAHEESIFEDKSSTNKHQEAIINEINSNPKYGWKAQVYPRFANYTVGQFKRLFGAKSMPESESMDIQVVTHNVSSSNLPKEFDARKYWSSCPNIGKIGDQGHCGCCWAFASVGALSDRFCIQLKKNVVLSVNDPLACCSGCGSCDSGYHYSAMNFYAKSSGIVTDECYPYFDKKGCPDIRTCLPQLPAPACVKKCVNPKQNWEKSKHFVDRASRVFSNPNNIMEEVYKNGPVSVMFDAYLDFATYKSGVYKHVTGVYLGKHVVKIIGWGTLNGEDYWLLQNQWHINWGDKGLIKFKRGTNECRIESDVVAATPSTKNLVKVEETISNYVGHTSI